MMRKGSSMFGKTMMSVFCVILTVPMALIGVYLIFFYTAAPFTREAYVGVIMMFGIVVNNAILIVHQALNNIRQAGMAPREAITESVRSRIRPIYMSSITTVCAMMPLILSPGAGSEFYRGLGSVVVGGILISTVFTIFLIPALLSLTFDTIGLFKRIFHRQQNGEVV